eukprot:3867342-Rhodomonas_salina.1
MRETHFERRSENWRPVLYNKRTTLGTSATHALTTPRFHHSLFLLLHSFPPKGLSAPASATALVRKRSEPPLPSHFAQACLSHPLPPFHAACLSHPLLLHCPACLSHPSLAAIMALPTSFRSPSPIRMGRIPPLGSRTPMRRPPMT